jgi:hypothetical protein
MRDSSRPARRQRQRLQRDLRAGAEQRLVALSLDFGVLETRSGGDPDANTLLAKASDKVAVSWPSCATSPAARTRRC